MNLPFFKNHSLNMSQEIKSEREINRETGSMGEREREGALCEFTIDC